MSSEDTGLLGCDAGLVFPDVSKENNTWCCDRVSHFCKFIEFHPDPADSLST